MSQRPAASRKPSSAPAPMLRYVCKSSRKWSNLKPTRCRRPRAGRRLRFAAMYRSFGNLHEASQSRAQHWGRWRPTMAEFGTLLPSSVGMLNEWVHQCRPVRFGRSFCKKTTFCNRPHFGHLQRACQLLKADALCAGCLCCNLNLKVDPAQLAISCGSIHISVFTYHPSGVKKRRVSRGRLLEDGFIMVEQYLDELAGIRALLEINEDWVAVGHAESLIERLRDYFDVTHGQKIRLPASYSVH